MELQELIDYLLSQITTNIVHVKKVEIFVSLESFKDGHIKKEVFDFFYENKLDFYIYEGQLFISRK